MSLHKLTVLRSGRALLALVCGLLFGTVVVGTGTADAQAPAPTAPPPASSAPTAAVPGPQLSPEETILQLKDIINAKDHIIAQLIESGAQCRDQLNTIERAQHAAKKAPAAEPPKQ